MNTEQRLTLNFTCYPLVTGQLDKYTFQDWQVEGGTIQLEVLDGADDCQKQDLKWSSSDETIAAVEQGKVRALTTGVADITVQAPNGAVGECRIQVIDNPGRLTPLKAALNTDRLVLNKTEGAMLYPHILPVDYFDNGRLDTTFTWTSSDPEVAVVDHRGGVYAAACGEAVITAVSNDIGRSVSCHIEVIKKSKQDLYADPLEDMQGICSVMNIGESRQLVLPQEVCGQPVCWSSCNETIAGVDEHGCVRAYRAGEVHIWATFINGGHYVDYTVRIEPADEHPVTEVHLSRSRIRMTTGEQSTLYAAVFPAVLLEKCLHWQSSDEKVCRIVRRHINLSGLDEIILEAAGAGRAVITGNCEGISQNCEVIVSEEEVSVYSIQLPDKKKLEYEAVERLIPICAEDDTYSDYGWLSQDKTAVTVDREGYVRAYKKGKVNIYCFALAGLTGSDRLLYKKLSEKKNISSDPEDMKALLQLSGCGTCAVCELEVVQPGVYLTNLHIPEETVTYESVCLLWNRESLNVAADLSHYEVYGGGQLLAQTGQLSYTVRGLQENKEYCFEVRAVDARGVLLGAQEVSVRTKKAPVCVIDVTGAPYNAVGNGIAVDTGAIQRAIDDCPDGGVVLLPKGYIFHSGALFLKSNMTFQVDGILFGSQDPNDYPPVVCRWEGYRMMRLTPENMAATVPVFDENVYSHASLINAGVYDEGEPGRLSPCHTHDIRICGTGMINGNGFSLAYNEGPCWYIYRKGLPVPQSPERNQNVRGRVIALYNTRRAYLSDVTVAYGPAWTIHPVFCDQVTCDNLKVISMGNGRTGVMEGMLTLNGDGIDPDSSINVNIVNCYFTVGDDAVAIKSGRNRQGNELDKPSAYIRVTDCICRDAKGSFCIGSEQAGGAHDILFQNLLVENLTNFGLWIKSAPCRGGLVEDVVWKDCRLHNTGGAIQIEYNHGGDEDPSLVLPHTRRISYENITISGRNKFGIRIMGVDGSPIHDVEFKGLYFENFEAYKERKFVMSSCHDIRFIDAGLPEGYEWEME